MKKILVILMMILVLSVPVQTKVYRYYFASSLTGGGDGSLDGITSTDARGNGTGLLLADGDLCTVMYQDVVNDYLYDSDCGLPENVPFVIMPDDAPAAARWRLQSAPASEGYLVNPSSVDQGVDNDCNSVADLINRLGARKATFIFRQYANVGNLSTVYLFTTTDTIPDNFKLKIEKGAVLSDGGGSADLTIQSAFEHDASQCFDWTGSGHVYFTGPGVSKVKPQLWGADPTDYLSDVAAMQAAATSLGNGYGTIYLTRGRWTVDSQITTDDDSITWEGEGHLAATIDVTANIVAFLPNASAALDGSHTVLNAKFLNLWFLGNDNIATAIEMRDIRDGEIRNCRFDEFKGAGGAVLWDCRDNNTIVGCHFYNNSYDIYTQEWLTCSGCFPQTLKIRDNYFGATDEKAIYLHGDWADVTIEANSFAGQDKETIVADTGDDHLNLGLNLQYNTFEKVGGDPDVNRYLHVVDTGYNLSNANIIANTFYGGAVTALKMEDVDMSIVIGNRFSQSAPNNGVLWDFDAACDGIFLWANKEGTGTQTISADTYMHVQDGYVLYDNMIITARRQYPTATTFSTQVWGDADYRLRIYGNGQLWWGDGTNPVDTTFYRSEANTFRTDDRWLYRAQNLPTGSTPSIEGGNIFYTNNSSPTNVTDLSGLDNGDVIWIIGGDGGNTTIKDNGAEIALQGNADFTLGNNDVIFLVNRAATIVEVSRSDN